MLIVRPIPRAILIIHEMETQHAKLMVLPGLCILGYACRDLFLQKTAGYYMGRTFSLAEETADVDALIFVETSYG